MITSRPEDIESKKLLEEILEDKPKTPECKEDKEYGRPLIWTKAGGWRVE